MKKWKKAVAVACAVTILSGCSSTQDTEDQQIDAQSAPDLISAPADSHWAPVAGISAPVESADGPSETAPVLHGYKQTPQGAVVAAINGQVAMATASDDLWDEVSMTLLAPGEGRDQWAQGRALVSIPPGAVQKNPATFEGFKIADYSGNNAQVLLAAKYPGIGLTVYPVQLGWDGDWKIIMPTLGSAPDLEHIDSLDGFTAYSANN